MSKTGLITFGDGSRNWSNARDRLMRQANKSKYFRKVEGHDLSDLKDDLTAKDLEFIETNRKNLGFCLFKPISIQKHLRDNPEIDSVVYLDAGSEINPDKSTKPLFQHYISEVREKGFLGFQLDNLEKYWTKTDLFNLLKTSHEDQNSGQIAGGHLLFSREFALQHCQEWLKIMRLENYHYLDDSKSIVPEPDHFISHRYDQSISSLLLKNYSTNSFRPASEMEPSPRPLESQSNLGPFVALRNASRFSRFNEGNIRKSARKLTTHFNRIV